MSVTLKQLRYFVAAAESGQISTAARALSVSQSAVTSAIQSLEASVGAILLDRGATGVTPTLEGMRFLHHARSIGAAVDEALRAPLANHSALSGQVRIGLTYTVAGYFMPPHLAQFRRSHPDIRVDLVELPRSAIEAGLAAGELDLAVMLVSNLADHAQLDSEILLRSGRRLWLSTEHPLLRQPRLSLADVAGQPYVMLTVDEAAQTARRYWDRAGSAPQVIFETSSVEAVRSMVAGGMGVTVLSDMVYRPWSLEGLRLEQRRLEDPIPSMDVGLAWSRAHPLSEAAEVFRAFMALAYGSGR